MNFKSYQYVTALALGALLLSSCGVIGGVPSSAIPTAIIPVASDTRVVSEGRLEPNQSAELSFKSAGQVTEILITEGEIVEVGQVIARLDGAETLQAVVTNAEAELLDAQQARMAILENAGVKAAAALQAVADARDAVRDAERRLNNLQLSSDDTDIDLAEADVAILKDRLDDTWEDYKPYQNKPEDDVKRAIYLQRYAQARQLYDNATRKLNNLQGSASDIDMAIAEANLSVAQAQLLLAEQDYDDVRAGGPDPKDVAIADARVKAAETSLAAAQASLKNIELAAPFGGKIVDLHIAIGEQIAPNQPAAILADFSKWIVETGDLTELEVPEVSVGQSVIITPDAFPGLELAGTVERISDTFEEKQGDITYTVRILLNQPDEHLRWGMTVVVTFEK